MRFGKFITTALVAGASLALSASAFAQNSAGTLTTSDDGIHSDISATAIIANINFTHTFTSGAAVAAAASIPLVGAFSGGASLPEFSYINGTASTSSTTASGSPPTTTTASSFSGTALSSSTNGTSATDAFNGQAVFVHIDASQDAGSGSSSATHGTGVSVSSLFVFEQTNLVTGGAELEDDTGSQFFANLQAPVATSVDGSLALNQVAGIGNQQGNNLSTVAEVTGAGDTTAGSNAVENEGRQTLVNEGTIEEETKSPGDEAALGTSTSIFGGIAGAVALNQAAGTANQQVNNITLAH